MGAGSSSSGGARTAASSPPRSACRASRPTGTRRSSAISDVAERRRRERDASARRERARAERLEAQLNQARRLESVGQLAGGIAHDFNNLLGVIINYAKFVAEELRRRRQAREDIEEIRRAAERAADLTRQLLIFSRREVVQAEVLDLNGVVADLEPTAAPRARRARRRSTTRFAADLWPVEADPGQIEQVLVNLAVNARDAMPGGGRLHDRDGQRDRRRASSRETHRRRPRGATCGSRSATAGVGMDEEVRRARSSRSSPPSRKGEGPAWAWRPSTASSPRPAAASTLYSEPGIGTTVKVHLPARDSPLHAGRAVDVPRRAVGHGETVLIVEDEAARPPRQPSGS